MEKMPRNVAFARILLRGREGYALQPSKVNPRVKRWMKLLQSAGTTRGKASISPSGLEKTFVQYLNDPEEYKKMPPLIAAAAVRKQAKLPYDVVAHLSRLQTAAWQGYGGAEDLLKLIRSRATMAGQFGQDHQALMEHMWSARPGQKDPQLLLTDTYDATAKDFPEWAKYVEQSLPRLGGEVLGAIPRTSAFQWDWSWGPPEPGKIRQDVGGRTILINPEATLIIAPPPGREAEFAREYFQGVKKDAPKAAEKSEVQARLNAVWLKVRPAVRKGLEPTGKYGREYSKILRELGQLQGEEAKAHTKAYQKGQKLAPIAWYEPDTRTNFDVGQPWQWGRLAATENGIHYVSADTSKPGPQIVVSPDIAQWIPYSQVSRDDAFLRGAQPRRFAGASILGVMEDDDLWTPMTYPYSAISLNNDFATVVVLDLYDDLFGKYDDPRWPSNDPAYEVPFCLPDPSGQGGWVAVLGSQVHVPPIPGPWRNTGNGPLQVLWVNGAGEWGYSSHPTIGPGSLRDMKGSLRALRATIRPVREFKEFDLPPQEFLQGLLESNAENGWPLERLIALARGDISVDNPTLKLWLEDGNPSLREENDD